MQPIALAENTIGRKPENGGNGNGFTENGPMYTLNATGVHGVAQPIAFSGQMSNPQTDVDMTQTLQAKNPMAVAQPLPFGISEKPDVGHCLRSGASKADKHESTTYVAQAMAVAFSAGNSANARSIGYIEEGTPPLRAGASGTNQVPTMAQGMAVRRLTPVECERLQGFPDRYTDIQPKGKATPDGPRYKALGNSMAVPVMAWIGKRIQEVDAILKTRETT
jgi:DNA (cytosine-5)-methyltransferase 1